MLILSGIDYLRRDRLSSIEGLILKRNVFKSRKHLPSNFPVEKNFTQPLPIKVISMSNDVNCKFSNVNVVNIL